VIKWKVSFRFYKICYYIALILYGTIYRLDIKGRENVPQGATMVCANHSNLADPILVSLAFGTSHFMHYIAKIELFRIPILSAVITKLGAISVDRDLADIATIKATLTYLKNDGKVVIFPEGTRTKQGEKVEVKTGAVKIAERTGVPIVPIYVEREKKLFRKLALIIGEPYTIEKQKEKRHAEEYTALSEESMNKIEAMGINGKHKNCTHKEARCENYRC